MSIYGISTEFTESVRFVTTVHSIDLFSDRNGSKWAQTNTLTGSAVITHDVGIG